MKIIVILPEFEEGGVERHVLWLCNGLVRNGHEVLLVTAGGKLASGLDERVRAWSLPVHRKNPFTALYCAFRLALKAVSERWDLLHAHSRVPVWIAWWTSVLSGKPWVFTAHDRYRKNAALFPFRKASAGICVSQAVREHLDGVLPATCPVIRNGLPASSHHWLPGNEEGKRLLFVGRLTRRKGLHVALDALGVFSREDWTLDVVGDGPMREELENQASGLGLGSRVRFRGFRNDVEKWMESSACLLFPSLDEGMPLTLMQGVQAGIPCMASDIQPVRELLGVTEKLVPPGDIGAWRSSLEGLIVRGELPPVYDAQRVPSVEAVVEQTEKVYADILGHPGERTGK